MFILNTIHVNVCLCLIFLYCQYQELALGQLSHSPSKYLHAFLQFKNPFNS